MLWLLNLTLLSIALSNHIYQAGINGSREISYMISPVFLKYNEGYGWNWLITNQKYYEVRNMCIFFLETLQIFHHVIKTGLVFSCNKGSCIRPLTDHRNLIGIKQWLICFVNTTAYTNDLSFVLTMFNYTVGPAPDISDALQKYHRQHCKGMHFITVTL